MEDNDQQSEAKHTVRDKSMSKSLRSEVTTEEKPQQQQNYEEEYRTSEGRLRI